MFVVRRSVALFLLMACGVATPLAARSPRPRRLQIDTPLPAPNWAVLERALLDANAVACREFYARYFDEAGRLRCVERWGGDDGPDDAIENCNDWPILHALGGADDILRMYKQAWEGHLRQYTEARTTHVPFAKEGMYYKEFPVMFDWQHNAEGLQVFNLQPLSDPDNRAMQRRIRRFAGFYMGDDPGAPNYDPRARVIRSMINGSRGPLMRKATAVDWAGDPIEVENRFDPRHGERSYAEMLAHFKDYNDVVGDHPLNLLCTTLALNAYMIDHQPRYKKWLLEYVDAWYDRMRRNNNLIPSNIGLDGKIGGAAGGKWYGGTYGWAFTVKVPQTGADAHRNRQHWSFTGFANAYLLTGDDRYLDIWRKQQDTINAAAKTINGKKMYPRMYGDRGWYAFTPQPYTYNSEQIYYLSMKARDYARTPKNAWFEYLAGRNPNYPEEALRVGFAQVAAKIRGMRADTTTPDTRLADDPNRFNPCTIDALLQLTSGGMRVRRRAPVLYARVRYFDPVRRRAGLPQDVAALVHTMSAGSAVLTLVNLSPVAARDVILQAGGYGEHEFQQVTVGGNVHPIQGPHLTVRLQPGCGARLRFAMRRYVNPPTMQFPWQ